MEIKYVNNDYDMFEYGLFDATRGEKWEEEIKAGKFVYKVMAILSGIFAAINLLLYLNDKNSGRLSIIFSMILMALITLGFQSLVPVMRKWTVKRDIKKTLEKNGAQYSEVILDIDNRNLSWTTDKGKGSVKLTEEIDVWEKPLYYFINTKKASFVVPKRVFDDDTFEQFRKALNLDDRIKRTSIKDEPKKKGKGK